MYNLYLFFESIKGVAISNANKEVCEKQKIVNQTLFLSLPSNF